MPGTNVRPGLLLASGLPVGNSLPGAVNKLAGRGVDAMDGQAQFLFPALHRAHPLPQMTGNLLPAVEPVVIGERVRRLFLRFRHRVSLQVGL